MKKHTKKSVLRIGLVATFILIVVFFANERAQKSAHSLPNGIAQANGRIEARQIDIASKITARVSDILVQEGDLVAADQLLAVLDTTELEASLAAAEAQLALSKESILEASAQLDLSHNREALARKEFERIAPLVSSGGVSKQRFDQQESAFKDAQASTAAAIARLHTLEKSSDAARAQVRLIQSQIDDCQLRSPVRGRVLYRLHEVSEVVATGNPLLTVLNLSDIYMEIYLPASAAARLAIGAEARLKLDILPEYTLPATITFVSPQAQFTPKQVETKTDRENLMFRVKLRIPKQLVERYIERVKTGVRGDAYVQIDPQIDWPEWLQTSLPEDVSNSASQRNDVKL